MASAGAVRLYQQSIWHGNAYRQCYSAPDLHKRAAPFGLEGAQVDGSDVEAVAEVAGDLISDAGLANPGFWLWIAIGSMVMPAWTNLPIAMTPRRRRTSS